MEQAIHTVVGAGQIGVQLAHILVARGCSVRLISRSGTAAGTHVTAIACDITDPASARMACAGSSTLYNCTNVAYHRWDELLAPVTRGVLDAAVQTGARLVALDNLYMYGRPRLDRAFDEDTPIDPCSRKGALRAELARELAAAHARGDVRSVTGRASDFFGQVSPRAAIFHPRFFARLARGKVAEVLGDPDQPHAYSYTPDVAEGLALLGERDDVAGVWHLPVAWKGTTRGLIERFAAAAGTHARVRTLPRWMVRFVGLFSPEIRAVPEMIYQWETPYALDDTRFCESFGVTATPIETAVAATLAACALPRRLPATIPSPGTSS